MADAKGKGKHRKLSGLSVSKEKEILKNCAEDMDYLQSLLKKRDLVYVKHTSRLINLM